MRAADSAGRADPMRNVVLVLCIVGLTGCGIVKRVIPRPSPRVIVTGGTIVSMADKKPCGIEDADIVLAAYYTGAPVRLPT